MSIFGGFKGIPVTYSPDQITTTVQTLFNKLPKKSKKLPERECEVCNLKFLPTDPRFYWCTSCTKLARKGKGKGSGQGKGGTKKKRKPEKPGGSLADDDDMFSSPDASASTAELLIARPCISMSPWRDQGSEIPCGDVNLIMDARRDWQAFFKGVLGSFGLYFRGLEVDMGELLDSEAMKCFMLSQGLAHDINPSTILAGYRLDATHCKANLSANSNSLVKMHLDFFKMTSDCALPDDIEICNDLLQLDAGLSFQVMQILE
jgi:hypothetical protein